jgi:hypothetical protein
LSSSYLKEVRTRSEEAKMGRKKTHEKNRKAPIGALISQDKKKP